MLAAVPSPLLCPCCELTPLTPHLVSTVARPLGPWAFMAAAAGRTTAVCPQLPRSSAASRRCGLPPSSPAETQNGIETVSSLPRFPFLLGGFCLRGPGGVRGCLPRVLGVGRWGREGWWEVAVLVLWAVCLLQGLYLLAHRKLWLRPCWAPLPARRARQGQAVLPPPAARWALSCLPTRTASRGEPSLPWGPGLSHLPAPAPSVAPSPSEGGGTLWSWGQLCWSQLSWGHMEV